jgi:hypothetical protein
LVKSAGIKLVAIPAARVAADGINIAQRANHAFVLRATMRTVVD